MRCVTALGILLIMTSTSWADSNAGRFRIENGRLIVAQSYCGMCADAATSCRLGCNGSGTCIQACDDQLRECRWQNCGSRAR
jgi:hypothetical protein